MFWGLVASMWIGNLMLVVLNLPLVGIWVKLLRVPYRLLFPMILFCCARSARTAPATISSIYGLQRHSGCSGYVFVKLGCEPAPLLLGYILGPMMEENLRRALVLSRGDFSVFVTRPMSLAMLVLAVALLAVVVAPGIRKRRDVVFAEKA